MTVQVLNLKTTTDGWFEELTDEEFEEMYWEYEQLAKLSDEEYYALVKED